MGTRRHLLLAGLSLPIGAGWSKDPIAPGALRTATGILVHHPADVRSAEAWRGHRFDVDGVPVQPSDAVSEATLLRHVGKNVAVSGQWNPGVVWDPARNEGQAQAPRNPDPRQPLVRGDGIVLETLRELK